MNAAVVKRTQEALGKVIRRPPLTEKLLNKPPFRYLHDIITEVGAAPGSGMGCGERVGTGGAGRGSGPRWGSRSGPRWKSGLACGLRPESGLASRSGLAELGAAGPAAQAVTTSPIR